MEKIIVTKKDKDDFKKTTYGKKCYNKFNVLVILLFASCVITGLLTGYEEAEKKLFEHQNIVLLVMIVIAIICSEQIGRCEGALNEFVILKKKENKEEHSVKNISKETNKIPEKKVHTKDNNERKNINNKTKHNNRRKNEK